MALSSSIPKALGTKVSFFFEKRVSNLKKRRALKIFIEGIFKKERKKLGQVNYIFCSDKRLLEINRKFLQHDYYTDIISFDLSESHETVGEIYISIDRVKENARSFGVSIEKELLRVIIHGALHLCGFSDKSKRQKLEMRAREDYYLKAFAVPRGAIGKF